jgi:hypothetical protein
MQAPVRTEIAAASTVFGVPLEPGERVIYYRRINVLPTRIFLFLMGIPLILLLGLGIYMIYTAIRHRPSGTYAHAITTNRLLSINGLGTPLFSVRWDDVAGLNEVRKGGGLAQFGVRDRSGKKFLFNEDLGNLRAFLTRASSPGARAQLSAVPFDAAVS